MMMTMMKMKGRFFTGEESTWIAEDYIRRRKLLHLLIDGTLVLEVCIKSHPGYSQLLNNRKCIQQRMFQQYLDENKKDIAFKVGSQVIKAHQAILKAGAPELHELSQHFSLSDPFPINDVDPEIWKLIIGYIYGDTLFDSYFWKKQCDNFIESNKNDFICIIRASDKYGIEQLKNDAETWLFFYLTTEDKIVASIMLQEATRYSLWRLEQAVSSQSV